MSKKLYTLSELGTGPLASSVRRRLQGAGGGGGTTFKWGFLRDAIDGLVKKALSSNAPIKHLTIKVDMADAIKFAEQDRDNAVTWVFRRARGIANRYCKNPKFLNSKENGWFIILSVDIEDKQLWITTVPWDREKNMRAIVDV